MVPLSEQLIAEGDGAKGGKGIEREQMLASLHANLFGTSERVCLGRFELGERRGAGAMGVVYEARDPALDRSVALKVLRAEVLDGTSVDRFVLEARALAKLRHPNVVTVYEVGADGEERFIVMDLVQGDTLRRWLSSSRSWQAVVRMFIGAGQGLQAAHEAGLVHRDFKPDNVLVENEQPRVVDFGLVSRTEDSLLKTSTELGEDSGSVRCTQTGAFVGTPVYMAPEQARGQSSPAADQYAFCVALFEGLCGKRPHADVEPRGAEAIFAAREMPADRTQPRGVPRWLRHAIARGLAPDPAARWPSMEALLHELRRVDGNRKRGMLLAAGGLGLTATAAGLGSLWQTPAADLCDDAAAAFEELWSSSRRAELEDSFRRTRRSYAPDTWRRVETHLDRYAGQWAEASRRACVVDLATSEHNAPLSVARQSCLERRKSDFSSLLATFAEADVATVDRAVDAAAAIPALSTCDEEELLRELFERGHEQPQAPSALYETVSRSDAAYRVGHNDKARAQAEQALQGALSAGDHELTTLASLVLSRVHKRAGKLDDAVGAATDALEAAERLGDTGLRARARLTLLAAFTDLRDFKAADRTRRVLRASVDHLGDPTALRGQLDLLEAWLLQHEGKLEPALRGFERTEALLVERGTAGSPMHGRALLGQGTALAELGRYADAAEVQRRAVELLGKRVGPLTPGVIKARMSLSSALSNAGKTQEGLDEAVSIVEDADVILGKNTVLASRARATLAIAYATHGKLAEAERLFRDAAVVLEQQLGTENPDVAGAWSGLARVLVFRSKPAEAVKALKHAREIMLVTLKPTHPDFIYIDTNLAEAHIRLAAWLEAETVATRGASLAEQHLPMDNPRVVALWLKVGVAQREQGRLDDAALLLESLLDRLEEEGRVALIGAIEFELALTVEAQGRERRALSLMRNARIRYVSEDNPGHEPRVAEIEKWLESHGASPRGRNR